MDNVTRLLMQGAAGVSGDKTYVDDVFSTYVYTGDGTNSHQIVNGIDLAGEGGLIWGKERTNSGSYYLFDTERGLNKRLKSNSNGAEETDTFYSSVNSDGYTIEKTTSVNISGRDYVSWTFRKTPGFFDVVSYTGNASAWNSGSQVLNHSLGCVPGLIIIKSRNQGAGPPDRDWYVYHKDIPNGPLFLNYNSAKGGGSGGGYVGDPRYFNDPLNNPPTASTFQVGDNVSGGGSYGGPPGFGANENGQEYIAYLFAGGDSTAATARSAYFDSSNINRLRLDDSADWIFGDTFTLEAWIKLPSIPSSGYQHICAQASNYGFYCTVDNANKRLQFYDYHSTTTISSSNNSILPGQWIHVALVNNSGTAQWYINGKPSGSSGSLDVDYDEAYYLSIGGFASGSQAFGGYISNLRIVKGTAVYTSAFKPSTKPLASITNTVLLCCQTSTVTDAAVSPGPITNLGNGSNVTTASTDSPFDDPEGFKFGEGGDQNIIKCGSYNGNGSTNGPEINLGFEPQWLLIKRSDVSEDWMLFDHMRTSRRQDMYLDDIRPNTNGADGDGAGSDSQPYLNWTSTGFKLSSNTAHTNGNGNNYIYIAIRRSDGAVGKPITNPIEAFDIKLMETNGTEPFYKTQNTVDMGFGKRYDTSGGATDWFLTSRFQDSYYLDTRNSNTRQWNIYQSMDYQQGWNSYTGSWGDNIGFAWKRHAGFDVVSYTGSGSAGHQVFHNLNQVPEMIWVKCLTQAESWIVYHKGLNGGTNPHDYYLQLNSAGPMGTWNWMNGVAPTETHFTLGSGANINFQLQYMAYLWATVEGISKVGYYSGSGAAGNAQNIGFQPRLVLIKNISANGGWMLINSVHGFSKYQLLNSGDPFVSGTYISPSATGFSFTGGPGVSNELNKNYIYYAHA